jgi:hypothetical protein
VNFPALSVDVGWALHEILQGGVDTAPLSLGGFDWSVAESASDVRIGARIRIDAWRFETEARECFGADWRTGYFYGKVTKKNAQRVWASYDEDDSDDDDTASHFSFLELGVLSGAVASHSITPLRYCCRPIFVTVFAVHADTIPRGKAIVHWVQAKGLAEKELVGVGDVIERVNDTTVTAGDVLRTMVCAAGEARRSSHRDNSDDASFQVTLRRASLPVDGVGNSRSANCRSPNYDWHADVRATAVALANEPENDKRPNPVFKRACAHLRPSGGGRSREASARKCRHWVVPQ